ncbi:putative serine/threonine-protein phosphatase C26H8.05c [Tritrichomonas foetus]|uniref:Serine/threonine-protein phosphatase n=1 Tax=Tritrichomonas foetus TaxID=1144522 RepID=A0A1J4JJ16_9EUKA|nr:putative serine/threonine-protein phosphatase C26H8.05c [Tritrichomonas foetus]|eukprot:OHS97541.1 putative serine/threonine-protein phosphatase C26H8.05c [Tritrichomonas foetus]
MNYEQLRRDIFDCRVIDEPTVVKLLYQFMELLHLENNIIFLSSEVIVVGDIHGQLFDLYEMFNASGGMDPGSFKFNKNSKYLFLGDYVDRGYHSLNTFLFLVTLKLEFPGQFTLLRGNHESRMVSFSYGFHNEVMANYGHTGIWSLCNEVFDLLPIAALVDGQYFCVHGGLSPELPLIDAISLIDRQTEVPTEGALADLLWSDPSEYSGWSVNKRGVGYMYGPTEFTTFCRLNNIKMIVRSHQLAQEGFFKYYKAEVKPSECDDDDDVRVLTVWSAPDYEYKNGNKASVMQIKSQDEYELIMFEKSKLRKEPSPFEKPVISYYFA